MWGAEVSTIPQYQWIGLLARLVITCSSSVSRAWRECIFFGCSCSHGSFGLTGLVDTQALWSHGYFYYVAQALCSGCPLSVCSRGRLVASGRVHRHSVR